jgi:hypothetical protein
MAWLGIMIGVLLPLVSALLYRTYELTLPSASLEITRQLGLPFALGELAIVVVARRHGLDVGAILAGIGRWPRCAIIVFPATFWISSVFVARAAAFSTALALLMVLHLHVAAAAFHLARGRGVDVTAFAGGLALGLALLAGVIFVHLTFRPSSEDPAKWLFGPPIPGFISIRLFGAWAGTVLAVLLGIGWSVGSNRSIPGWLYPAIALAVALVVWSGTRAVRRRRWIVPG